MSNRQRRQIEIPFEAGEAFDLLDAAIRELPRHRQIESARDSLQVRAKLQRIDPYGVKRRAGTFPPVRTAAQPDPGHRHARRRHRQRDPDLRAGARAPGPTGSCVDDGTNLENAEAITRAITRRVAERRRGEQASARRP